MVFAIGFIAAALSSMLTVALGASITADTVYSDVVNREEAQHSDDYGTIEKSTNENSAKSTSNLQFSVDGKKSEQKLPRWAYQGMMWVTVLISTAIVSANADRTKIIEIAQVFNGCLLPFFSMCLLVCLNDSQFMAKSPQKGWSNLLLLVSVTITFFLASNVVVGKITGKASISVAARLGIALGITVVIMTLACTLTSLGREIIKSFKRFC